ncbi:alpha/beta fold hydrolase [Sutcliffiella sp. NC1]|uniref:alpha/beta fold hydrolase n=1 Tax=Sutcliffiella sp. NC1 TaxID=3004096 RepID=UPI0022DDB453|nr:alpha/beta hydrolase [Sutcliffiella sp. NC1]WBL17132.1 alpha/beta hydrolase [Sutcliffiella sp. NC1]
MEGNFITLNNNKVYVTTIGEGEPIVFLHGGPGGDHRFFLPYVKPLAAKYKLVLYDQRGCGKSDPIQDNQYSMEGEVRTLELLREELNLEKINLFGESWGSMLALLYATSYPEKVNKIFLTAAIGMSATGFKAFEQELLKKMSFKDKAKLFLLDKKMQRGKATIENILDILDPYYVFSKDTLRNKVRYNMNSTVNHVIGEDIKKQYDLTEKVHELSDIPIMVAQGSHDTLPPEKIHSLLVKYIPHARLMEIKNCGHWTVVEKPNEINSLAFEFFC